ncbi:hypothetical protein CO652_10980 [Rhizobium sp. H4]|nr:hypothetical protein CO652_10980 [Rhizobium sp. H4]
MWPRSRNILGRLLYSSKGVRHDDNPSALIQEGQHDIETGRLVSFDSAEELTALILQAAAETDN